jgi:hypothetical protein
MLTLLDGIQYYHDIALIGTSQPISKKAMNDLIAGILYGV